MTCPTYYLLLLPLSSAGDEKHFWFRRARKLTIFKVLGAVCLSFERARSLNGSGRRKLNVYETVRRLLHCSASQF